jgi:hypothetical protein
MFKIILWLLLLWIIYSICVVIYLRKISKRFLTAFDRSSTIGNRTLKDSNQLRKQYQNSESINVLVLTGGGIRGLAPLVVLSYLEKITKKNTGELFDIIAGTSIGAICATYFATTDKNGAYTSSAKKLMRSFIEDGKKIFYSPWYHKILTGFGIFAPVMFPTGKRQVLKKYFGNIAMSDVTGNIMIPVYNLETKSIHVIKNWKANDKDHHHNFLVVDVVDGASNPPLYFMPTAFKIKNHKYLFIDPALNLNNPVLHTIAQTYFLFPDKKINIVVLDNGSLQSSKFNYRHFFSFGLYGILQYIFNAPGTGGKLLTDLAEEYLADLNYMGKTYNYFYLGSNKSSARISISSVSKNNMSKIRRYGYNIIRENRDKIDNIASELMQKFK